MPQAVLVGFAAIETWILRGHPYMPAQPGGPQHPPVPLINPLLNPLQWILRLNPPLNQLQSFEASQPPLITPYAAAEQAACHFLDHSDTLLPLGPSRHSRVP